MIVYERLWETMKVKNMSQYRLINYYNISSGQLSRLRKNMYVSTHTIDTLCGILNCSVEEIMEFRPPGYQGIVEENRKRLSHR